jgi:hypothetical protein
VLGKARRQVSVMVLHREQPHAVELVRVLRGEVLRVQVVGHDLRLDREQALEVLDPLSERPQRLEVLEVADVVADPGALALRHAERVLQLGAAGEDLALGAIGERHARRDVAA